MKTKIDCVLLVDDDEATNFIHNYVLKEANFASQVRFAENGLDALEYLNSIDDSVYLRPDLIFVDINMPVMNGWDFLKQYKLLNQDLLSQIVVVMLTTSYNPDDRENSANIDGIDHFMSKPLTLEMLQELQTRFFAHGL